MSGEELGMKVAGYRPRSVVVCDRCAKTVDEPAAFGHRLQEGTLTVEVKRTHRRDGMAATAVISRRRFCGVCAPVVLDVLAGLNQ